MASSRDPDRADLARLSDEEVGRELALLLARGSGDEHDLRLQRLLVEQDKRRRDATRSRSPGS